MKLHHLSKLLIVLVVIMTSCTPYNRMTSPEVLDKSERDWNFGVTADPVALGAEDLGIYAFQPVVGYRTGLGNGQELGTTLHGVYFPALAVDYKHRYYTNGKFTLSGDLSLFGGPLRSIGAQYELLMGSRKLYGSLGANYDVSGETAYGLGIVAGVGSEISKESRFGFQLSGSMSGFDQGYLYPSMSLGLKMKFVKSKKKYREGMPMPMD